MVQIRFHFMMGDMICFILYAQDMQTFVPGRMRFGMQPGWSAAGGAVAWMS